MIRQKRWQAHEPVQKTWKGVRDTPAKGVPSSFDMVDKTGRE